MNKFDSFRKKFIENDTLIDNLQATNSALRGIEKILSDTVQKIHQISDEEKIEKAREIIKENGSN